VWTVMAHFGVSRVVWYSRHPSHVWRSRPSRSAVVNGRWRRTLAWSSTRIRQQGDVSESCVLDCSPQFGDAFGVAAKQCGVGVVSTRDVGTAPQWQVDCGGRGLVEQPGEYQIP
jgi:hypothetical protein